MEGRVWSVEFRMWSVECGVRSGKWKVWSVGCRVSSVEYRGRVCRVRSVKCRV